MKKNIAIVDDEYDILNVLETFLSRRDAYDIRTYASPDAALAGIKENRFDLVLLDIMMPTKDGIDMLKEIKAHNPNIKVVMMTAFSTQDRVVECSKIGADDYVTKPFISLKDVEAKILDLLEI
jgi:DNA-binding NtrC family response regulator